MSRKEYKNEIKFQASSTVGVGSRSFDYDDEESTPCAQASTKKVDRIRWWRLIVPPVFLSLFTAFWYYPSLYYAFQFDDLPSIVKFFDIRHKTFNDLFLSSTRWMSAWLNTIYYKIGKFDPWAYRFGNVAQHCLAGSLLFFVLFLSFKRLKKTTFFGHYAWAISSLTTALFLLHPVQTQTVSYVIQGQLEGLSGLFMIAILFCFMAAYTAQKKYIRLLCLVSMYLLAFLSMGTKEIAIVSPLLVLMFDWFFIAQGEWALLKKRLVVHALLLSVVMGTYFYLVKPHYFFSLFSREIQNNIGNVLTEHPATKITFANYSISQFKVIVHYMLIFVWPFAISVDYDWKISKSFFSPDCFFPFLVLFILGLWMIYRLRKNKTDTVVAALLWFFIAILPRASIIPATELMADYKTYLASVGVLLLLSFGLIKLAVRFRFSLYIQYGTALCFIIGVGFLTYQRNLVWHSSCAFWENIIKHAPTRARAHNNYGVALSEKGEHAKAVESFKVAIRMDRNYADPCNNIAVAYCALGQLDNAIMAIRQSLRINPYQPESYNNLASFFLQKKEYSQVEQVLRTALKLRPHYGKAYFNLGRFYSAQGDKQLAYESFKDCCTKADFDNEMGFGAYAAAASQLNKYDEAIAAYHKALECKPGTYEHVFNLANAYFMTKKYDKARDLYAQLYRNNPNDAKAAFNLAEAQFALGDAVSALNQYNVVHTLNPQAAPPLIRAAACHQQLGNKAQARALLDHVMASEAPEELKNKARVQLAQLGG